MYVLLQKKENMIDFWAKLMAWKTFLICMIGCEIGVTLYQKFYRQNCAFFHLNGFFFHKELTGRKQYCVRAKRLRIKMFFQRMKHVIIPKMYVDKDFGKNSNILLQMFEKKIVNTLQLGTGHFCSLQSWYLVN